MRWLLLILAALVLALTCWPRDLPATRVVGDQRRAERLRGPPLPRELATPRTCPAGESPTDRSPCVPLGAQFAPSQ